MSPRLLSILHFSWLAAILAVGLVLRGHNLQHPVLFIDEAESAINAMSILEHGVPVGEYLGQPMFENTLIQPWPEHPEYEFRDISYSDRGLAIYHGWLPLYAIASSYRLAGITPDEPTDPPRVTTTPQEMRRRTVAARAPAVVFGMLFLAVVYIAGREMAGREAGLMAVTIAALAPPTVRVAREARYYAPAHLLGLLCCLAIWLMWRRGRWGDFILAGVAFALLFHTHVLTFAIAAVVWAALVPAMLRHPSAWQKLAVAGGIVFVAVVPWMIWTGFPGSAPLLPAARSLVTFPQDYAVYLSRHWKLAIVLGAGVVWIAGVYLMHRRLPGRVAGPFMAPRRALLLLLGWLVVGYVGFLLLVPAPSAFLWRLTLGVHGPGILFVAILLAAGAQVIDRRWAATAAAVGLGVAMLLVPAVRRPLAAPAWPAAEYEAIDYLNRQEFASSTRLYAVPLHHLTLTLLAGVPVQSTAPVRASFFDDYPGEMVILETVFRGSDFPPHEIAAAATDAGVDLAEAEARQWSERLRTRLLREELAGRGAILDTPLEPLPDWLDELVAPRRSEPRRDDPDGRWDNPAMFRGHEAFDRTGFWQTFFYRFVDPQERTGRNLNYADRVRGARAQILDSTWVVFHSPARNPSSEHPVPVTEGP